MNISDTASKTIYWKPVTGKLATLKFKFISNTFYSSDAINTEFLADLTNMNINGPVTHNYFSTPNLAKYLISYKDSSWFDARRYNSSNSFFASKISFP